MKANSSHKMGQSVIISYNLIQQQSPFTDLCLHNAFVCSYQLRPTRQAARCHAAIATALMHKSIYYSLTMQSAVDSYLCHYGNADMSPHMVQVMALPVPYEVTRPSMSQH